MNQLLHHAWARLAGLMPGEVHPSELMWLISPHSHFQLLSRRRASMIVNRVRLFSFLFAVLTPLWSIVDYIVFPFPLWFSLAAMRILVSGAFALLVMYARPTGNLATAYRSMLVLFAIPTLFFVASHEILASYQLTGISAAMGSGYAFLPFVLLAGLSIFPLTLIENILVASPMLMAQAMPSLLHWDTLDWAPFAGAFWLLALITAVSTLAGLSQLTFMIAIVQQAIRDPITGAYSRRCGQEALELQFSLAERTHSPLAVAFLDLDHFKSINDNYGHDAGDRVLMNMASWIMSGVRRGDILCRWGGEEFVVIMPNTDLAQAALAIDRIRQEGLGTRPDGVTPLTASIGIAEWRADRVKDWKDLVEVADQRMYLAKAAGRDRVVTQGDASTLALATA
jgi:diguanylate cyclase (GGDEF)-like protein